MTARERAEEILDWWNKPMNPGKLQTNLRDRIEAACRQHAYSMRERAATEAETKAASRCMGHERQRGQMMGKGMCGEEIAASIRSIPIE